MFLIHTDSSTWCHIGKLSWNVRWINVPCLIRANYNLGPSSGNALCRKRRCSPQSSVLVNTRLMLITNSHLESLRNPVSEADGELLHLGDLQPLLLRLVLCASFHHHLEEKEPIKATKVGGDCHHKALEIHLNQKQWERFWQICHKYTIYFDVVTKMGASRSAHQEVRHLWTTVCSVTQKGGNKERWKWKTTFSIASAQITCRITQLSIEEQSVLLF